MRASFVVALLLLAVAVLPGSGLATSGAERANNTTIRIVAVVPNPLAPDDRGEYLVVAGRGVDLSGIVVEDGEAVVALPNRTIDGPVALSTHPRAVPETTTPVLELDGNLQLSNAGEHIVIRRGDHTLTELVYGSAPEGEEYRFADGGWTWRPPGTSDFPVFAASGGNATVFTLPDAAGMIVRKLEDARKRIRLAGYTFGSEAVTTRLCRARARGVIVEVLLEREPVGGITKREAGLLDRLRACGVSIGLLGGSGARYSFHHAKYAIIDDVGMVLSENWKPSGTGGRSNRGWGIVVRNERIVAGLAGVFEADRNWRDVESWSRVRKETEFVNGEYASNGRFAPEFEPRTLSPERFSLVVAPDNAEEAVIRLIDGARTTIAVQQLGIGSRHHPFVDALIRAAKRGVRVRVLLSRASYVRADNREMVEWLNERASRDGLTLSAKLARPRSRFGKIHVKGVIVDDAVLLGSLNWNAHATRKNREVSIIVRDDAAAEYYRRVFRSDWRGGVWRLSVGSMAVVLLGLGIGAWRALGFTFESRKPRT